MLRGGVRRRDEVRAKFHRRRAFNDSKDIDYINKHNRGFNDKIEKSFNKYTQVRPSVDRVSVDRA